MSSQARFDRGRADLADLERHLLLCNDSFVPQLKDRVDIRDYAAKMRENAELFEAWSEGELVGLVAAYCNRPESGGAFVTNVSVLPNWQGRGLALKLMSNCADHALQSGFSRLQLEVNSANHAAVSLYRKLGFSVEKSSGDALIMSLTLGEQK